MTTRKQLSQIIKSLAEVGPEERAEFVAAHIEEGIPFQIRANRIARGWSQSDLGNVCGMKQTAISRLEGGEGGLPNLGTLLRIAQAFDVVFAGRFMSFSELLEWSADIGSRGTAVPSFGDDIGLFWSEQEHQASDTVVNLRAVPVESGSTLPSDSEYQDSGELSIAVGS